MSRVARLARALQVYLNRQGVILPCMVEPVLIAGSPAVHIDVIRPIVRIVQSDAIKQWAAALLQARPILRSEVVFDVVDRLLNPRSKPVQRPRSRSSRHPRGTGGIGRRGASLATTPPARPRHLSRRGGRQAIRPDRIWTLSLTKRHPTRRCQRTRRERAIRAGADSPARRGLSGRQLLVLVVMVLVEFAVLAAFLYLILFGSR